MAHFLYWSNTVPANGGITANVPMPNGVHLLGACIELNVNPAGPAYGELIAEYGPLIAGVHLVDGVMRRDATKNWPLSWTGDVKFPEVAGSPCFVRYSVTDRTGNSYPVLLSFMVEP